MQREENFVLVPATFRERKNWWSKTPRTLEQIKEQERVAAERRQAEETERAAKAAEEEAAFQLEKEAAEKDHAARFSKVTR